MSWFMDLFVKSPSNNTVITYFDDNTTGIVDIQQGNSVQYIPPGQYQQGVQSQQQQIAQQQQLLLQYPGTQITLTGIGQQITNYPNHNYPLWYQQQQNAFNAIQIPTNESVLDSVSNSLFFENTEERFYIDYKTKKILRFENKAAYESYLEDIEFNKDFEEKIK